MYKIDNQQGPTVQHRELYSILYNKGKESKKEYIYIYIYVGEGSRTPLQYSCLENPMNGGAWWAAVHGVTKSQT